MEPAFFFAVAAVLLLGGVVAGYVVAQKKPTLLKYLAALFVAVFGVLYLVRTYG